jgi:hypothetical protein
MASEAAFYDRVAVEICDKSIYLKTGKGWNM